MAVLLSALILLAITGHSSAATCVCKDGVSEQVLQKAIDYACGNGADCSQIQQSGPCFQPNTVKNHCDYAVNNYYQKKGSSGATCDFSGAATLTNSASSSTCGSSSGSGTGTPTPPTSGTPSTGTPSTGTPSTGTPSTGTPTTPTPSTNTPTTTPAMGTPTTGTPTMGIPTTGTPTTTGTPSSSVFPGTTMGPTGSGFNDQSHGVGLSVDATTRAVSAFLLSGLAMLWG